MKNYSKRVGFIQGRLSPLVGQRIQAFPVGTWEQEFSIALENGIENMEWTIDTISFESNPLVQNKKQKIIELSKNTNVKIPSVTCDYFMENPHWNSNGVDIETNLIRILRGMIEINSKILVIPLVDNSSIRDNPNADLKFFLQLEKTLIENNLQIAFELDLDAELAKDFINLFSPLCFGINYDVGNSAANCFDPDLEISAYGDRIINVHVKDRVKNGNTVPLGAGNADFTTVIHKLREVQFQGNYIMQTARATNGDHIAELNRNIKFFKEALTNV